MTTAGAGAVVSWVFQCLQAHALVTPDQATEYVLAASIAPLLHGAKLGAQALALSWLEAKAPAALSVMQQLKDNDMQIKTRTQSLQFAQVLAKQQTGANAPRENNQAPAPSTELAPTSLTSAAAQLESKTNG